MITDSWVFYHFYSAIKGPRIRTVWEEGCSTAAGICRCTHLYAHYSIFILNKNIPRFRHWSSGENKRKFGTDAWSREGYQYFFNKCGNKRKWNIYQNIVAIDRIIITKPVNSNLKTPATHTYQVYCIPHPLSISFSFSSPSSQSFISIPLFYSFRQQRLKYSSIFLLFSCFFPFSDTLTSLCPPVRCNAQTELFPYSGTLIFLTSTPSISSSLTLRSMPPAYPVRLPLLPITRWHGIRMDIGLWPTAPPTAWADMCGRPCSEAILEAIWP